MASLLSSLSKPKSSSTPTVSETLDQKFKRKCIRCSVSAGTLPVRSRTSVNLHIPTAQVTSCKPRVYRKDGGFKNVLYSHALDGNNPAAKSRNGFVLNRAPRSSHGRASIRPLSIEEWSIKDGDSDSTDALRNQCYGPARIYPRLLSIPGAVASVSCPPLDVDYSENGFNGTGVTFEGIGDSCVLQMALENGSVASLMLPSGLITSYKAPMWHGNTLELLHTSVSQREDGGAHIEGGHLVDLECRNDSGFTWSPTSWALQEIRGGPEEFIQVKLVSRNPDGIVQVQHNITLQHDLLSSKVTVSNLSSSSLQFEGSIISHLTLSTPEATYAVGLEGADYCVRPPAQTEFSIVPPGYGKREDKSFLKGLANSLLGGFLVGPGKQNIYNKGEIIESNVAGQENDSYKHLAEEMSRVYTNAPRNFTIIDRGRRNSVIIQREGFNELYMFSPGSKHDWYGKYAYICIGQAATLQPIILEPQGTWRGCQRLCNPNL